MPGISTHPTAGAGPVRPRQAARGPRGRPSPPTWRPVPTAATPLPACRPTPSSARSVPPSRWHLRAPAPSGRRRAGQRPASRMSPPLPRTCRRSWRATRIPHRARVGPRRHGRRLPGRAPRHGAAGRAEGHQPRRPGQPRRAWPASTREVRAAGPAGPPEHRPRLRRRAGRRPALPGHGVRRGRRAWPGCVEQQGAAAGGPGLPLRPPGGAGPAARLRARHGPPRRQAAEPDARRRKGQVKVLDFGLARLRQASGRPGGGADAGGRVHGHAGVRGPRAGDRRRARPTSAPTSTASAAPSTTCWPAGRRSRRTATVKLVLAHIEKEPPAAARAAAGRAGGVVGSGGADAGQGPGPAAPAARRGGAGPGAVHQAEGQGRGRGRYVAAAGRGSGGHGDSRWRQHQPREGTQSGGVEAAGEEPRSSRREEPLLGDLRGDCPDSPCKMAKKRREVSEAHAGRMAEAPGCPAARPAWRCYCWPLSAWGPPVLRVKTPTAASSSWRSMSPTRTYSWTAKAHRELGRWRQEGRDPRQAGRARWR